MVNSRRRVLVGIGLGSLWLPIVGCGDLLDQGWPAQDRDPVPPTPSGPSPEEQDVTVLNAGIMLEQTAVNAYQAAAGLPFIQEDPAVLGVAGLFKGQHEEHRDALIKIVQQFGGAPVDPASAPPLEIPPLILDESADAQARKVATLKFARQLERQAADTYFQLIVAQLRTDVARRSATEILPVEAQHVALLDFVLGQSPVISSAFFSEQT